MARRTNAELQEEIEQLEAENERLYRRCQRLTDAIEGDEYDDDEEGEEEDDAEDEGDEA